MSLKPFRLGKHDFDRPVFMAPLSGASDAPFRKQAIKFGAPAVVSEMVASELLVSAEKEALRRTARHEGGGLFILQLAGCEPRWMEEGARMAKDLGADIIDINMGCPAKRVTGGQSGSALMKDLELASTLIAATVKGAGATPVTLKMRLGWDDGSLNADQLSAHAENLGVQMLTIHGRTRCQFYEGQARWDVVGKLSADVSLPVIVNGDVSDSISAELALRQSDANGVMIGRHAIGHPWLIGKVAGQLSGEATQSPSRSEQLASLIEQIEDSIALYGLVFGIRRVRKHLSAWIAGCFSDRELHQQRRLQKDLCTEDDPSRLISGLMKHFGEGYKDRQYLSPV